MAIKIEPCKLFNTPEAVEELHEFIQRQPRDQRAALTTVMAMTWNYLAKEVEKQDDGQDV